MPRGIRTERDVATTDQSFVESFDRTIILREETPKAPQLSSRLFTIDPSFGTFVYDVFDFTQADDADKIDAIPYLSSLNYPGMIKKSTGQVTLCGGPHRGDIMVSKFNVCGFRYANDDDYVRLQEFIPIEAYLDTNNGEFFLFPVMLRSIVEGVLRKAMGIRFAKRSVNVLRAIGSISVIIDDSKEPPQENEKSSGN